MKKTVSTDTDRRKDQGFHLFDRLYPPIFNDVTMFTMPRALLFPILILPLILFAGCATVSNDEDGIESEPGVPDLIFQIIPPHDITPLQVQQAIVNAAFRNQWTVAESEWRDRKGLIRLTRRDVFYDLNLTLEYDAHGIDAFSESYIINRRGEQVRRYNPRTTLSRLRREIAENLRVAAQGF